VAARNFPAPARKVRPLVASFSIFGTNDPELGMKRYLAARPALAHHGAVRRCCDAALETLEPLHQELLPLMPALTPLWTHNDLHPSNLFWSDKAETARATAVIDFGLVDRTNAVHDIAQAIERSMVEWLVLVSDPKNPHEVPVHFDHLKSLLDGYESIRPLSAQEAAALAPMTALCHAEFALSEADYLLGVLHSEEKAPLAYDGYLVGHARWFRSAAGTKMLDALRRRAETVEQPIPGASRV
jgi:Ser/Thr protein kinase RdoA (MazF antagonist)